MKKRFLPDRKNTAWTKFVFAKVNYDLRCSPWEKNRCLLRKLRAAALLSADVDHGAGSGDKVGFADMMAGFFLQNDIANEGGKIVVRGAATHEGVQVVIPNREKTRA